MTSKMTRSRIGVILLFAITFTIIGWIAPAMYASYTPQENVIENHKFTAQDTTPNADSHYICFDRTVHQPSSGSVFTELYVVDDKGERIEVVSDEEQRYFQSGRSAVVTSQSLPDNLKTGEYRYIAVVELNLVNGRVERTLTFESQTFNVSENVNNTERSEAVVGC